MKMIKIADMTLRDETMRRDMLLGFREKLEIAKQLDTLNVDIIEMAALSGDMSDELLVKSIASVLKNSTLSLVVGCSEAEIDKAWNAVKGAQKARLHVVLPVSSVQMEYMLHKKAAGMLELIERLVGYCASLCPDVEFSAGDATRSERGFLKQAIETAVKAGAKTVTLCDTIGTLLPAEIEQFARDVKNDVKALEGTDFAVQCSNEIKMAAACAFAAASAGTNIIKTTICGQLTPTLDAVAHTIRLRGDSLGIESGIKVTELKSAMTQLVQKIRTKRSENSPFDNGVADVPRDTDGIVLDKNTAIGTLISVITKMGYNLSEDDCAKVYEAFIRVAGKKQSVGGKELEAIIASTAMQVPPAYKLISYVINSGNILTPTANIVLEKNGVQLSGLCAGDGPIDAAFLAIEKIIGHHYELDDFQIQSVTEGREAMADTLVKLRCGGVLYSGKGISTDVIGASIRAYINALNKIVYEEETR